MIRLCSPAQARLFRFDEVSDMGFRADIAARPQVSKWANLSFVANGRLNDHAVLPDEHAFANQRVSCAIQQATFILRMQATH